jgi:predicted transcriptional regulator
MEKTDIAKKISLDDVSLKIKDFATDKAVHSFGPKTTLRELAMHFYESTDQTACVVEDGKLLGIVSRNDLVYNVHQFFENRDGCLLEDIMIRRPFVLSPENTVWDGLIMIAKKEVSSVAIVEDDGTFIKSLDFSDFFKWIIERIDLNVKLNWKLENWTFFDTNIMEVAFDELEVGVIDEKIFDLQCYRTITAEVLRLDASTKLCDMRDQFKKYRQPQCVITKFGTMIKGIISADEIIELLLISDFQPDPNTNISDIMNIDMVYCMYKHTFKHGITLLLNKNSQRLLVVDEDSFPMSIMRYYDMLKYITDTVLSEGADRSVLKKRAA